MYTWYSCFYIQSVTIKSVYNSDQKRLVRASDKIWGFRTPF